jgi:hypothetical protein
MMQSCASAAKLRSGGPILPFGLKAKGRLGIPPPRTVIGVPDKAGTVGVPSASSVHCAARKTTPSNSQCRRPSRPRSRLWLRAHGLQLSRRRRSGFTALVGAVSLSALGHVWTAPWQELSDVAAALVGCGHVSSLFVRRKLAIMLRADRVPIVSTHSKMRRPKRALPIPGSTLSALRRHVLANSIKP